MPTRSQSLRAFWPVYLNEHSTPASRWLHFIGTTTFLSILISGILVEPIFFPVALLLFTVVMLLGLRAEPKRAPFLYVLAMLIIPAVVLPGHFLSAVVTAYAFAWVGHFVIEKNRPATFRHPLYSLVCDFWMWSWMLRGKLWTTTTPTPPGKASTAT